MGVQGYNVTIDVGVCVVRIAVGTGMVKSEVIDKGTDCVEGSGQIVNE